MKIGFLLAVGTGAMVISSGWGADPHCATCGANQVPAAHSKVEKLAKDTSAALGKIRSSCDPSAPIQLKRGFREHAQGGEKKAKAGPPVYDWFPIDDLEFLSQFPQSPVRKPDSIREFLPSKKGNCGSTLAANASIDAIANGTYCSDKSPMGLMMKGGVVELTGPKDAWHRGGVAVLENGKISICRIDPSEPFTTDRNKAATLIQKYCAQGGSKVKEFLGGGSYLMAHGKKVSSSDVIKVQKMASLSNWENRFEKHTMVAIKQGRPYLVFAQASAQQMQADFCKSGFESLVKFDGSKTLRAILKPAAGYSKFGGCVTCTSMKIRFAK